MLIKGIENVSVHDPNKGKIVAKMDSYGFYETEDKEVYEFLLSKDGYVKHPVAKTKKEYWDFVNFKSEEVKNEESDLVKRAKELGIPRAGNMKPETLEAKIKDAESAIKE